MTTKNVDMKWKLDKSNAREAWLPGLSFVYLRVRMVRTINLKIKVMFKTDEIIALWVGINGGFITVDEYYEMLNLIN